MESTGKYWIPVFNVLETTCHVVLAHPKYLKYMTGEKNRAQNCLTVSNIKLDDVFSDVFGKAASAITERLLENSEPFDVTPYLTKNLKSSPEKIQAAVDGMMCANQAEKLRIIRSHMDSLELCKANLESEILGVAEKYLPQANLVVTVPGIQAFSSIGIIGEIGVDMSVFETSRHLCSWAGLTPQNDQSAGKKKTTRISRAGAYIKPLLVQCANAAIRDKKHPRNRQPLQRHQEAARTQESDHRYRQNAADCHLQHPEKRRTLQRGALPPVGQAAGSTRSYGRAGYFYPATAGIFGDSRYLTCGSIFFSTAARRSIRVTLFYGGSNLSGFKL